MRNPLLALQHSKALLRAVLIVLLFAVLPARGESPTAGRVYSVLSYNVHGLFRLIAKDNPGDRSPIIGWFAADYDIVLLQEDFEYYDVIAAHMGDRMRFRGNGMGWDPRRVAVKALLFPLQVIIPHFSPPYGAGLSTPT